VGQDFTPIQFPTFSGHPDQRGFLGKGLKYFLRGLEATENNDPIRGAKEFGLGLRPQPGVQNDLDDGIGSGPTHVQGGIVLEEGVHSHQNGVVLITQPVDLLSCLSTGDPLRLAATGGDLAIQGQGQFEQHKGSISVHEMKVFFVQDDGFTPAKTLMNTDALISKPSNSLCRHLRIGISHRHIDLSNPCLNDSIHTGRSSTLMGAGFQIEIETGPGGLPARPLQGHHLGVVFLLVEVISFGDDSTLFNQHRPYQRIGADSTQPTPGQGDGPLHEPFVRCFRLVSLLHSARSLLSYFPLALWFSLLTLPSRSRGREPSASDFLTRML